jgi:hypothetical protein
VASARSGLFFAAAALLLTWPLAVSPGDAISVRDDYWSNLWNAWWVRRALFELQVSPYWTDQLFYPSGVSLGHHTLSPLNAVAGALASFVVSPATAYNLLLWVHFWLSGWAACALARYETGNDVGATIAGLVYAFCPIHYFYLPQINVATFEFLPLAFLFFLKTYREGGARNAAGAVASVALLAASSLYFLVYALLFALLLLFGGRLWHRPDSIPGGGRRLLATGVPAALVVVAIGWPLFSEWLPAAAGGAGAPAQRPAGSDLLGFNWSGAERALVSWPSMLGYAALLLAAAGIRGWRSQRGWIVVGAVFWLLGLGSSLRVAGTETGVPLPYALVAQTPLLGLLRMSNRFFVVTQLAFAVLCAAAWKDVSRRRAGARTRAIGGAAAATVIALELTCVPLRTFRAEASAYLSELAGSPSVRTLVELPTYLASSFLNGRYVFHQTLHEKKIPQGYVTTLAVSEDIAAESRAWLHAQRELVTGNPELLATLVRERGIDRVVLNKRVPRRVPTIDGPRVMVWVPFVFTRSRLVVDRQLGQLRDLDVPAHALAAQVRALSDVLGGPVFEDAIVVFAGGAGS